MIWGYWDILGHKIKSEDFIDFEIFMNFINFSCLIFFGPKYPDTP